MDSTKNNILHGRITSTLVKLAIPLMGMSALQMAYNLTDMFWIGKLGTGEVASVGTVGTVFWLAYSILAVVIVGSQVTVGQSLGARNFERAGRYAYASIIYGFLLSLLLTLIMLFLPDKVISIFGLNDAKVISDAIDYLVISGGLMVFPLMSKLLTTLISVSGNTKIPFFATVAGLILNMILDPLLIFGGPGIPAMGVKGAAIATALAQIIVFLVLFIYSKRDKVLFKYINYKELPKRKNYLTITKIGFPVMVQTVCLPIINIFIARLVAQFGDAAVAVQRVGSQIESISWMTTDGFGVATNAFIAQNYGAKNYARAKAGYSSAARILFCVGVFATVLLFFGSEQLMGFFFNEPEVIKMGSSYLKIAALSQIFLCFEILSTSSLSACGKTTLPSIIGFSFTSLRIPAAFLLSATVLKLDGIWWAISMSTIFKGTFLFIAVIVFFNRITKTQDYDIR